MYIAYDMDAYENQDVAKQLIGLLYRLRELGYNVSILQWDREFKGLDVYLISTNSLHERFLISIPLNFIPRKHQLFRCFLGIFCVQVIQTWN